MSEATLLGNDEEKVWRSWIQSSKRVISHLERDLRSQSGIAFDDYEVLSALASAPGKRMTMSNLGSTVVQSLSRLSQRIDRMERDGLVERQRSDEDRRVFFAALTAQGTATFEDAAPGHMQAVREVLIDRMSQDEIRFLAELLPRVHDEIRLIQTQ